MNTRTDRGRAFLTPTQAADALGINTSELAARRRRGTGPRWLRLTDKCVRYDPLDVPDSERARARATLDAPTPNAFAIDASD